ncbi:unnamed protein product, partial [Aureobasidium vineae]
SNLIISSTRTRTPFLEFTVHAVDTLCKCIAPVAKAASSKHKRAASTASHVYARSKSSAACEAEVSRRFTEPWHFAHFSMLTYNAKELRTLCDCALGKAVPSTSKESTLTSTRSSSSTRKSSSSTKKSSPSTKKSSSSIRKSSSSIKTSSSTVRTSSSGISKAVSTSSKIQSSSVKSSSSANAASSTRLASASLRPPPSASKITLTDSRVATSSTLNGTSLSDSSRKTSSSISTILLSSSSSSSSSSRISSSSRPISIPTIGVVPTTQASLPISEIPTLVVSSTSQTSSSSVSTIATSTNVDGGGPAPVTPPAITSTSTSTFVPEITTTIVSCDGLLCIAVGVGASTTTTFGIAPTDDSDLPTATDTASATEISSATAASVTSTNSPTASVCTPVSTACDGTSGFVIMASSSDSLIDGLYAASQNYAMYMNADYASAARFCLDSDNTLVWLNENGPEFPALKSSIASPITFSDAGIPLFGATMFNADCTVALHLTWSDDFRTVVDSSDHNPLSLTDDTESGYVGDVDSTPISLIVQA